MQSIAPGRLRPAGGRDVSGRARGASRHTPSCRDAGRFRPPEWRTADQVIDRPILDQAIITQPYVRALQEFCKAACFPLEDAVGVVVLVDIVAADPYGLGEGLFGEVAGLLRPGRDIDCDFQGILGCKGW